MSLIPGIKSNFDTPELDPESDVDFTPSHRLRPPLARPLFLVTTGTAEVGRHSRHGLTLEAVIVAEVQGMMAERQWAAGRGASLDQDDRTIWSPTGRLLAAIHPRGEGQPKVLVFVEPGEAFPG